MHCNSDSVRSFCVNLLAFLALRPQLPPASNAMYAVQQWTSFDLGQLVSRLLLHGPNRRVSCYGAYARSEEDTNRNHLDLCLRCNYRSFGDSKCTQAQTAHCQVPTRRAGMHSSPESAEHTPLANSEHARQLGLAATTISRHEAHTSRHPRDIPPGARPSARHFVSNEQNPVRTRQRKVSDAVSRSPGTFPSACCPSDKAPASSGHDSVSARYSAQEKSCIRGTRNTSRLQTFYKTFAYQDSFRYFATNRVSYMGMDYHGMRGFPATSYALPYHMGPSDSDSPSPAALFPASASLVSAPSSPRARSSCYHGSLFPLFRGEVRDSQGGPTQCCTYVGSSCLAAHCPNEHGSMGCQYLWGPCPPRSASLAIPPLPPAGPSDPCCPSSFASQARCCLSFTMATGSAAVSPMRSEALRMCTALETELRETQLVRRKEREPDLDPLFGNIARQATTERTGEGEQRFDLHQVTPMEVSAPQIEEQLPPVPAILEDPPAPSVADLRRFRQDEPMSASLPAREVPPPFANAPAAMSPLLATLEEPNGCPPEDMQARVNQPLLRDPASLSRGPPAGTDDPDLAPEWSNLPFAPRSATENIRHLAAAKTWTEQDGDFDSEIVDAACRVFTALSDATHEPVLRDILCNDALEFWHAKLKRRCSGFGAARCGDWQQTKLRKVKMQNRRLRRCLMLMRWLMTEAQG